MLTRRQPTILMSCLHNILADNLKNILTDTFKAIVSLAEQCACKLYLHFFALADRRLCRGSNTYYNVKSTLKILSIFVAFLENMNFIK